MADELDREFWERHWKDAGAREPRRALPPNPYLLREAGSLAPGTALDAGCGEGAEAIWLAGEGWEVTAADISTEALARAADRAARGGAALERLRWVDADLSTWEPPEPFDLVTTHYAHPAMPQLAFYQRIADWVAPGGTLLIVGHLRAADTTAHGHGHPEEVSVTAASITALLDPTQWSVVTADEPVRTLGDRTGRGAELYDVVVRATRRR